MLQLIRTIEIKYFETYQISELIVCYKYYFLSLGCMNTTEFVHLLFIPCNRKHSSQHNRYHHRTSISFGVDIFIQFVPSIKLQTKDKNSCYFGKVLLSLFKVLTKTEHACHMVLFDHQTLERNLKWRRLQSFGRNKIAIKSTNKIFLSG